MSHETVELDEAQVQAWGRAIGAGAEPPLFLALHGPLGAGKSVLARSIARGSGVSGPVPSPTYTLVQSYEPTPSRRIVHIDLYRLEHPDDVLELGWDDELADERALVIVEWAERAGPHLPRDRWSVRMSAVAGEPHRRRVEWHSVGRPPALPRPERAGRAVR